MRDMTIRGRCLLGAGLAAVLCGVQVGQRDFVRIGLVVLAAPLLAWVLVRLRPPRIWLHRNLGALRVEAGETAQVEVEVGNRGSRTGPLLVEEQLPRLLGSRRDFLLDPMLPGEQATLRYLLRTSQRGRYAVGPALVHAGDPLGLVDVARTVPGTDTLLVTPRTEALPAIALSGRLAGAGDNRTRELLGGGNPDVTIREYRRGDDLRRIHWPTSARTDTLMVRREEMEWQLRCTLLLDHRRFSHRGHGHTSTLEPAVSATASLVRHLSARGFEVHLRTAAGHPGQPSRAAVDEGVGHRVHHQLEQLAVLAAAPSERLDLGWVAEGQQGGLIVAVVARLGVEDRHRLAGLAAAGDAAYAVVLDTGDGEAAGLCAELARQGWRAAVLPAGGALAATWQELGR